MQRALYSGYLSIANIIFRSQFTLPPSTDISITDKFDSRPYKTFFVRNLYTFYFKQYLVSFKLFSIVVILFFSQSNGIFRYIKMKIGKENSPPQLTRFPVAKMFKAQWGRDANMDAIMEISASHGQPALVYSENQYQPQQQHFCPFRWLAFSHTLQTVVNKQIPNYHTNVISSNILSLGFLLRSPAS